MNERIKELAGQASFDVGQIMAEILCPDYYGAELYKLVDAYTALPKEVKSETVEIIRKKQEKFAELIIRDCMDAVDGYTKERAFGTHYDAVEQIAALFGIKHNGVEE
jgi:hypothetical protein